MTVSKVDVDDDPAERGDAAIRARHKKDAVNEALRDCAAKLRRAAEFDAYIERAQSWDYEAWRKLRAEDKAGPA